MSATITPENVERVLRTLQVHHSGRGWLAYEFHTVAVELGGYATVVRSVSKVGRKGRGCYVQPTH